MKYSFKVSDENRQINVTIEELDSCCDAKALINDVISRQSFIPSYSFFIDMRRIKYTPIIQEVCDLSKYIISLDEYFQGPAAFVVSNEVHHYLFKFGTVLLTQKGLISRIFCDPEHARKWLQGIN